MKKVGLVLFLFIIAIFQLSAQCGGPTLTVNNPSFEGTPQPHITPPGWDICMPGKTPDTQPGSWGVTLPASNGSTYLGLVYQPSTGWQEGAGQALSSPMIAGTTYHFTIDLAVPANPQSGVGILEPPYCVKLQLWGGTAGINSGCDESELLWTSPTVTNTTWQTYNLTFTPTSNWNHILFLIYATIPPCTDGQYILVDNMTPIIPIADVAQFSATTVCLGNTTNFTDQSTSSSGTITNWTWDFGDGSPTSTQQNPTHTYGLSGTYNVTLTIISSIPCTTTVTHQVTVNSYPVVTATANPTSLCTGQQTVLTASGATSYVWDNGIGSTNPVTVSPGLTTTYSVIGTSNGCSDTASVTVNVGGTLNISVNPPNPDICLGTSVPLTASGGVLYTWSPSNDLSGTSGPNVTASPATTTTYTVLGSDSGGQCTGSTTVTVDVDHVVTTASVINQVNCFGAANGSASVNVISGTPSYSYSWLPSGGSGQTASNLGPGTYVATVVDSVGCQDTSSVTITQPTLLTANITDSTNVLCNSLLTGSAIVTANGGTPPYTFLWQPGGITTSSITNIAAGVYDVIVTDGHGCTATEHVTILQPPDISVSLTPVDESCPQSCNGSIVSNINGGVSPYTYHWNTVPPQSTHNATNLCVGTYTITVTDSNNCPMTANATIGTSTTVSANFFGIPDSGVIPLHVNFGYTGSGASNFHWDFGDGTTSTISEPSHIYTVPGTYTVTLAVNSGNPDFCTDTFHITIEAIQPSLLVMPNVFTPNGDGANDVLKPKTTAIETLHCVIYNRWGKIVYEWDGVDGSWDGRDKNGGTCSDGTYYYILDAKGFDSKVYNLHGTVTLIR